ncbi:MAG: zinc ABC transporter substrate-binding protein [Rhodospirillaceae bacterium]
MSFLRAFFRVSVVFASLLSPSLTLAQGAPPDVPGAPADVPGAPPDVIVSVRPIHSLVTAVMDGVAVPKLLLGRGETPHAYNLTPSDARALSRADMVVWIGEPLETFLESPLANLASDAVILELIEAPGLTLLDNRDGGVWDLSESGDTHKHDHDHDHSHDHGQIDGHIWLSPQNARVIVSWVAQALGALDPSNAAQYKNNAVALTALLQTMENDIRATLAPVTRQPFLTAHDALQYFDRYFDLSAVGAIAVTPDRAPSAKRLAEIRDHAQALGSLCILTEPGFEPGVMRVIEESADVSVGRVDPLGVEIEPGRTLYIDLMTGIAGALVECLQNR